MKLEKKHVIVTGAAAGIGRAICLRFASEGAKVSIVDINPERATALQEEIIAAGGSAKAITCNVCVQSECENAVAAAREAFGPVDIMVNCAGGAIVGGAFQRFSECTSEFIEKLIGVNLMGTLYFSRAVVPEMKERRSGKVLNFSSIRGIVGDGNCVLYGTAKGAIISFTESLAIEMGAYNVNVNAIAPGAINSRRAPAARRTISTVPAPARRSLPWHFSWSATRHPSSPVKRSSSTAAESARHLRISPSYFDRKTGYRKKSSPQDIWNVCFLQVLI